MQQPDEMGIFAQFLDEEPAKRIVMRRKISKRTALKEARNKISSPSPVLSVRKAAFLASELATSTTQTVA